MTTTVQRPVDDDTGQTTADRGDAVTFVARRVVPVLLVAGAMAALVRWAARPIDNPDTYFHLRFGREFLDGWSLRHPGHVTSWATADWAPTQWLPQEVMAKTEEWFGLPGVAWLSGLQFVALALALFLAARRFASPAVAAPLMIVALLGSYVGLSMRPQVLSYIATVVVTAIWMRVREDPSRTPWLLVPLVWVWSMCHGMWPLGVVISLVAVVGLALDRQVTARRAATLTALPVLGALAAGLLTPVGPGLLPAVLLVNSRGDYFSEWAPPDFTSPNCLALLALLAVTLLVMVRRRTVWFDVALVGLAGGFAVYSLRTVPVAACMLAPLAAHQLQGLIGRHERSRRETGVVLGLAVAGLAVLAVAVPSTSGAPSHQPGWVDESLSAMPDGTRVYNDMIMGGYLMWRYPELDFMSSGYGDIYTDDQLEELRQIGDAQPEWDQVLREADAAYALINPDSAIAYALVRQESWTVVHHSKDVELLRPPAGWLGQE